MGASADGRATQTDSHVHRGVEDPDSIVRCELATIIPVIATIMADQTCSRSCSFYIYDAEVTRTIVAFRHGESQVIFPDLSDVEHATPQSVPIEAEICRTRASIRRSTASDFSSFPMINTEFRKQIAGFVDVAVPLCWHEHLYGVVYLWRSGEQGAFTDDEVAKAEGLAQVAAMAVEFARQYGEERTRRLRLNALLNVASLVSTYLTVDDVMPEITRIVRSVTEADVCNLYVFDDTSEFVTNAFSSGLNDREQWVFSASHVYPVSSVPAEERARETLAPVVVHDPENEFAANSELIDYSRDAGISEILVVPIVYQQAMIGVIYLWYRDGGRTFHHESTSTVQGIANQAGGVVSQARLYDASRQHINETEALRRIGETVLNSDSLDTVLDEIADVLAEMIPFDYAFAGTITDEDDVRISRIWGKFPDRVLGYRIPMDDSLVGTALRSGEVLNLANAEQDPRVHRYDPEYLPIRSVLIAPLVTENGTIGVLYIGKHDTIGFSARQERLMVLLSQQAAAAIERTQAREALALHAQRQTFLANVITQLVAAPEPIDALDEVAELGAGALADGVAIALSRWEYGEIRWQTAAFADSERDQLIRDALQPSGIVVDPVRVEEILASEEPSLTPLCNGRPTDGRELHPTVVELLDRLSAVEMLTVPMRQRGRAPGLMVLISSSPSRRLDDDVQKMAQIVANRIGDALERRQMAHNREALLRVSEAINTHADLDELLEMFADELHKIVPYDEMYLGELIPGSTRTRTLIFLNPHGLSGEDIEFASNEGVSGEVMQTRKALLDNYAHLRSTSAYGSDVEAAFYRDHGESAMAAPLIAEDTVIGVLFIGRFGANRFSESDFETFLLFTGLAASAISRTELLQHNSLLYRASVEVLAAVVDAKDPTTLEHSRNVAHYARSVAELAGLSASEIERVELAGLLHDIGKLSIPDHVLSKPGPLTEQERALINTHTERGASILNQHPALANLAALVRHHHERIDGSGYPDGLAGDEIPFGANIISVADAFDTMTSERTYQRRKSVDVALDELRRCAGTQFHAGVVELFIEAIRQEPQLSGMYYGKSDESHPTLGEALT